MSYQEARPRGSPRESRSVWWRTGAGDVELVLADALVLDEVALRGGEPVDVAGVAGCALHVAWLEVVPSAVTQWSGPSAE